MTNRDYTDELTYLEGYEIDEVEKKKVIEQLYRLAHMNFTHFIENNGHIVY